MGRAILLLWLGVFSTRLIWTSEFGWFVQERMKYPLLAASVALLIFGASEILSVLRGQPEHEHEHKAGPKVGWMLLLPLLVLLAVAPTGLGAAAADRVDSFVPMEASGNFEPIPVSDSPVEMRHLDFLERALWDSERSLEGVPVRLEGLVVNSSDVPDGFKLTKFQVSCCAADGIPLQISMRDTGTYEDNTWVIVDALWLPPPDGTPAGSEEWAQAEILSIQIAPAPKHPYESPY